MVPQVKWQELTAIPAVHRLHLPGKTGELARPDRIGTAYPVGKSCRPAVKVCLFYRRATPEFRWIVVSGPASCKNVWSAAWGIAVARGFRQWQIAPTPAGVGRWGRGSQNS